jgi:hypothetical protein
MGMSWGNVPGVLKFSLVGRTTFSPEPTASHNCAAAVTVKAGRRPPGRVALTGTVSRRAKIGVEL